MKNNVLKLMFAAALAMVAVYNVYSSLQENAMTELELANVEALASGEGKVTCEPDKGDTCLVGSTPVKDYDEVDTWF